LVFVELIAGQKWDVFRDTVCTSSQHTIKKLAYNKPHDECVKM